MSTFFSRMLRPRRARGQLHAPPARGQAEVNALLDPNSIAFDDVDNFILVIQEADPQARGLGIFGGRRPAPAATSLISPSPPDTASLHLSWSTGDDDFDSARAATSFISPSQLDTSSPGLSWSIGDHDYDPDARMLSDSQAVPDSVAHTDSSRALSPPASLLVEDSQPEAPSSSERSAPGASPPGVSPIPDPVGDVGVGPSAPYGAGVRGLYGYPGESSDSQAPDSPGEGPSRRPGLGTNQNNGGSQAFQGSLGLNTSVLSFSTNDTDDFTVRIRGESTHTSPTSSYHSTISDVSLEQTVLEDLRDEEREDE
ncbi:hypothetical protein VM1G_02008 [Cytospora mali]|uniref:Uncharacterized protein n=1 Tax=Cytospora mali TaxID=578113 RepID=A0A194VS01_CYTMA|nr:hypothetical protein VM1G_02008 [Valsa mali]